MSTFTWTLLSAICLHLSELRQQIFWHFLQMFCVQTVPWYTTGMCLETSWEKTGTWCSRLPSQPEQNTAQPHELRPETNSRPHFQGTLFQTEKRSKGTEFRLHCFWREISWHFHFRRRKKTFIFATPNYCFHSFAAMMCPPTHKSAAKFQTLIFPSHRQVFLSRKVQLFLHIFSFQHPQSDFRWHAFWLCQCFHEVVIV